MRELFAAVNILAVSRWLVPIALAAGGCGASSLAAGTVRTPAGARPLAKPQVAMVRVQTASSSARVGTDLILVTMGVKQDRVLWAGWRGGRLGPIDQPIAWSPDGRQIAFTCVTGGDLRAPPGSLNIRHDICAINASGTGLHQLTRTGDAWDPVWSPDGREIVFAREHFYVSVSQQTEGFTASMWMVHPDGIRPRQLTPTVAGKNDQPGSFSPRGRWLAFTRTEPSQPTGLIPNTSSVDLVDLASGTVRKLASQASDPAFSRNGKWIALSSTRDHNGTRRAGEDATAYAAELYLVDLTGNRWRRLTSTRGIDEHSPSFSPDGERVAYVRVDAIQTPQVSDSFHQTVYEINSDGSCPTRLRDDPADAFWYDAPTWRPRRSAHDAGPLTCARGTRTRAMF